MNSNVRGDRSEVKSSTTYQKYEADILRQLAVDKVRQHTGKGGSAGSSIDGWTVGKTLTGYYVVDPNNVGHEINVYDNWRVLRYGSGISSMPHQVGHPRR